MHEEIEILDCTLRDGGHVNNADFGYQNILSIESALAAANLDIIELGFLRDGDFTMDQSNYNQIEEAYNNISHIQKEQKFSVMIRPDWYDIKKLSKAKDKIKLIRFAFYLKDIELTKTYCNIVEQLGYEYTLNPVNIMGYTQKELEWLLSEINSLSPYAVTIVDTFGSIQSKDLDRIYKTYEEILDTDIRIGLHLHENMSSSFMLAQQFLKNKKSGRKCIIDGSLLGMGRIPGNLPIEMLLDYMNSEYGCQYDLNPILKVISDIIEPIKNKRTWGYHPAYYFTAKYQIHRSYAEYYVEQKKDMTMADMLQIFEELKYDDEKTAFSKNKADKMYEMLRKEKE